jgi:hypothetical protein
MEHKDYGHIYLPPLPPATSNPCIKIDDIKNRRFSLLNKNCPVCGYAVSNVLKHINDMAEEKDLNHIIYQIHES